MEQRPPREPLVGVGELEHHESDMTFTAGASMTLAAVQARLRERGQWLPIDGNPASTLGELVLTNSTGPLRLGYGAWRDLLLGAQFRNGRDELITVGGRVLKNVAGYDLTKLLVGSHGVFGLPVTLTARTYRRPDFSLDVEISRELHRVGAALTTELRPTWAVVDGICLRFGYLGSAESVGHVKRKIDALEPLKVAESDLDGDARARGGRWTERIALRASVPPKLLLRFVDEAGLGEWSGDAAFGIVVAPVIGDVSLVRRAIHGIGGRLTIHDGDGRATEMTMHESAVELIRRIKSAMDPDGRLPALPRFLT